MRKWQYCLEFVKFIASKYYKLIGQFEVGMVQAWFGSYVAGGHQIHLLHRVFGKGQHGLSKRDTTTKTEPWCCVAFH